MIKETFRRIEYSDESKFLKTDDRIELKEYSDDLVFFVNFNGTFDADKTTGEPTPTTTGSPVISDFDSFGLTQHGDLKGSVTYGYEAFVDLTTEGRITFRLSPGFDNAYGEQTFTNLSPDTVPADGTEYGFKLYLDDSLELETTITLNIGADTTDVFNALSPAISTYANTLYDGDGRIKVISLVLGQYIKLEAPDSGNSLLELMGGMDEAVVPNAPAADIDFLSLMPESGYANGIVLTHDTESHIQIKMYNAAGTLIVNEDAGIWSNVSAYYDEMELSWNDSIGQFFIGGELKKIFLTGFERANPLTQLIIQGNDSVDFHKIDELIIKDTFGYTKNYTPTDIALTPYPQDNPYADIYFGDGFKENEVTDLITKTSEAGINLIVKIGHTWYYYLAGAWRQSDGTYSQSTDVDTFEVNFSTLFFNENYDVVVRVFFSSDGYTEVYIDELSIVVTEGASAAAYITGTIAITDTVDLSVDSYVEITTDAGSAVVDLSSAAVDTSAVTLQEIKQAINDAAVPGLAAATDDGDGHLILLSSNTGSDALVAIDHADSGSALDLVWDSEGSTDLGEDTETVSEFFDYSELYRYVRSKLGAPLVPVELTDEQIDDCISSAVYNYNKWRNFSESTIVTTLSGTAAAGYEIPAIVGGEENITEIILSPRYPISYYNGRSELMANLYIQAIYDNTGIISNAADYHIALVATRDLEMILGNEVRWEFLNKRLYLYPTPPPSLQVGIKYKSALTLSEIVNSQQIKDFTLAEAKITLGNIRSTFGNTIPGGDGMIQLNGDTLKSEGKQERADLLIDWQKSTNVYEFLIG